MIAVIIAGGSGTRLWPLSTPSYPKQLLCIPGQDASLLQSTYDRARQICDDIYIVSEPGLIPHMKQQLPELTDASYIVEPARRGTANCIVASLARLSHDHDPNEAVAILSADHHIRDVGGFKYTFDQAGKVAQEMNKIVLVGIEPEYPSTGFGYIEKGDVVPDNELLYSVKSFKEKPDFKTAQMFLQSGKYLWNSGYFVGTLQAFTAAMHNHAPELYQAYLRLKDSADQAYEEAYLSLQSDGIDYALMEKVPDLLAMPANFDWMDLGSFADMHKAVQSDEQGNHVHGEAVALAEVENSFVQNYTDTPLAVIGLDNVVVVNTPQGTLVTRKDLSQKVGELSKQFPQPPQNQATEQQK